MYMKIEFVIGAYSSMIHPRKTGSLNHLKLSLPIFQKLQLLVKGNLK